MVLGNQLLTGVGLVKSKTGYCRTYGDVPPPRQLTLRAIVTGLCVGSVLCFSNTYFGLQTGWVTMGSLQSAILGFGVFKMLQCFECMKGFTMEENVIVQTTSVATATMPLAAGMPHTSSKTVDTHKTLPVWTSAYPFKFYICFCNQIPYLYHPV